jgi:uncharacterized protein
MPSWLRRRLARGKGSESESETPGNRPAARGNPEPPGDLEVTEGEAGDHAARRTLFPEEHRHGGWELAEVDSAEGGAIALVAGDEALASLDLREAIYLDIETTGLSGGAGTVPFLVALGRFRGGEFEMWQGFLRGPEEERAMLCEAAARIADSAGVVSFFGKSFDRHRLEDKMRIHAIPPPFADRPHLDLYHPLRRLYGTAFVNGRLGTMERELCGVQREDDLPGSFAPAAWFDFLGGRRHRLEEVFRHNLDDVLSLVVLAAHLGRSVAETRGSGEALGGPEALRARGLARLHAGRRERPAARRWIDRALARGLADERPSRLLRADLHRLEGEWEIALPEYEELAHAEPDEIGARALLEIAKISEHRARDRPRAREAVERARRVIERAVVGSVRARLLAECDRREKRLGKGPPSPAPDG